MGRKLNQLHILWAGVFGFMPSFAFAQTLSPLNNFLGSDKDPYQSHFSAGIEAGVFDGYDYEASSNNVSDAYANIDLVGYSRIFGLYQGVSLHLDGTSRLDRYEGQEDEAIDVFSAHVEGEFGRLGFGRAYGPESNRHLSAGFFNAAGIGGVNGRFRHLKTGQSGKWLDGDSSNFTKLFYHTPSASSFGVGGAFTYETSDRDDPDVVLDDSGPVKGFSTALNYNATYLSFSLAFAELSQNLKPVGSNVFEEEIARGIYAGLGLHHPKGYKMAVGYSKNYDGQAQPGGAIDSNYESVLHGGIALPIWWAGTITFSGAVMELREPINGDSSRLITATGINFPLPFFFGGQLDFFTDFITETGAHEVNLTADDFDLSGSGGNEWESVFGVRVSY